MKIQLIKKTVKITGTNYYYVSVDGDNLISATWTTDLSQAIINFNETVANCIKYPEDVLETLQEKEL